LGSFHDAAGAIRHQVVVSNTENDIYRQADIILQLMDRRVAGVAIVPTTLPPTPPHQILQLQKHGIPVVFCHRRVEGVAGPLLAIPFREVGRMAGEALARRGHRRVAMFMPHHLPGDSDVRKAGLREGLRTGGGDLDDRFSYCGESTSTDIRQQEEAVRSSLVELLHDPNRPTAICATFDNLAELIYLHLCKLGVRVPEEMSLVGFGGARRDGAINSRLTSVVMDEAEVGRRAVALLQRMQQNEIPLHRDEETLMPLTWAEGRTLGPVP
jgi:DNA-binding LacI/PurR family transcriptional regulator